MRARTGELRFRPLNLGRWITWGLTALAFVLLPVLFPGGFALKLMTTMAIGIVFALSYNMLLGQSGMLSFGHAVYSGLGAFFAIHAMNLVAQGRLVFPIVLLPLVGGLAGLLFGVLFGYVTTRRAGTPFAMITLGIGEMVFACALMFPGFFGGEGGISGNRTVGPPLMGVRGWNLGPDVQVYRLAAAWCFASMAAMFALTRTPLGRIANAVRDNPERAAFIGYDTQHVRWLMLMLSAFFAGIAGGLSAISFEIVTAENVGALRSGGVLLATFIGGVGVFFGPILGAIVFSVFAILLSEFTRAWQLYLGVFFVILVMAAPGGLASLVLMNLRVAAHGRFGPLRDPYVGVLGSALVLAAGLILVVEMTYHASLDSALGAAVRVFGVPVDTTRPESWVAAAALVAGGGAAFAYMWRRFSAAWHHAQVGIADVLRERGEGA